MATDEGGVRRNGVMDETLQTYKMRIKNKNQSGFTFNPCTGSKIIAKIYTIYYETNKWNDLFWKQSYAGR